MAFFGNLVFQYTTTTGTGDLTLTALSAEAAPQYFRGFYDVFSNNQFYYCIRNQATLEFEVGVGYMSDATTLVRQTVIESSNGNALVNFSAGTKDVISDIPAQYQASIADAQTWTGLQTFEGIPTATYTIGDVTGSPTATLDYGIGGNWVANGNNNAIRVYAYFNTPFGRVYSATPTQSPDYLDDNSFNDIFFNWSWDALIGCDGYILCRYSSDTNSAGYGVQFNYDYYVEIIGEGTNTYVDYGDEWSPINFQFTTDISDHTDAAKAYGPIRFSPNQTADNYATIPMLRAGSPDAFEGHLDFSQQYWKFRDYLGNRGQIDANITGDNVIATNVTATNYFGTFLGTIQQAGANNRLALLNSSGILTYSSNFKYIDTSGGGLAIGNASVTPTGSFKAWFNDSSTNSVQILFTNSSTGNTASDGYGIGIDTSGAALFNQRENNSMKWATNNVFYGQLNPTNGAWGFGNSSILAQTAAQVAVQPTGTSVIGMLVKGIASQASDYFRITSSADTKLYWLSSVGALGFGSGALAGMANANLAPYLDVSFGGSPGSIVMGAESNNVTRTNNTTKVGRFLGAPYAIAQNAMALMIYDSGATNNNIYYGGGSSITQAATRQFFYTASAINTNTGTQRLAIFPSGRLAMGDGLVESYTARLAVVHTATTTDATLLLRGIASQTGNLLSFQNSAGSALTFFDSAGNFNFQSTSNSTTGVVLKNGVRFIHTYGSTGGGAANDGNLFIGYNAGNFTNSGALANVGVGDAALDALTSGDYNTGVGFGALGAVTTGFNNNGIGNSVFAALTTGTNNNGMGNAVFNALGTSSSGNTGVGSGAGRGITSATNMTYLGLWAGYPNDTNGAVLSGLSNSTAVGANANVHISNAVVLGSSGENGSTAVSFGGIGTASPAAKWHIISTSNLFRAGYDTSNYFNADVSSTGVVTFNAVGSGSSFVFSDPVNITSSLQCDSIVNDTGLAAGTYTPTLTNVANLDASTAYQCQYMRVGNTVTVSGRVDIDPTLAATSTQLGISLPVASALSATNQLAGTAAASSVAGQVAAILGDATNDRATLQYVSSDVTNQPMYFTFTYQVL